MAERLVFESMCLDPGKKGFSYDTSLLVDVDQANDFDESVIRLTTKCNSIITQLCALGHCVTEFSIGSASVSFGAQQDEQNNVKKVSKNGKAAKKVLKRSGEQKKAVQYNSFSSSNAPFNGLDLASIRNPRNTSENYERAQFSSFGNTKAPLSSPSSKSTPETRILHTMEAAWDGLKRKNVSGMVAVARLTRSSIPRNGCGGKYSVQMLTDALVTHIHAYFMFQSFNPSFQKSPGMLSVAEDDLEEEYLIYLIYKIQPQQSSPYKKPRRPSELEKLEIKWPLEARKRHRQTSGGSSVDSSSSSECGSPGDTVFHQLPNAPPCCMPVIAGEASSLLHSPSLSLKNANADWTAWNRSKTALNSPVRRDNPDKNVSSSSGFLPPMILRSKSRTDLTVPARRKMF